MLTFILFGIIIVLCFTIYSELMFHVFNASEILGLVFFGITMGVFAYYVVRSLVFSSGLFIL